MRDAPKLTNLDELLSKQPVLRTRDFAAVGISRQALRELEATGTIHRTGRGLYVSGNAEPTEHRSFAEAAKAVPSGVVCLLSALRLHELTTQAPFEVWMAISVKAWKPTISYPPLRIVRFSGRALTTGVETRVLEGVPVRLYGAAKTVADCFKYRNKIGLDVALEALRDCLSKRRATVDEIWRMAQVCRVANVMRPYMEAVAA